MDATTERTGNISGNRPWHLLAVAALMLAWSVMAFAKFGPLGLASPAMSGWSQAFIATCVWGTFGGAVLLLARSRFAVQAFTTSLMGIMATSVALVLAQSPVSIYTMPVMFALWVITHAALLYALRVRKADILR